MTTPEQQFGKRHNMMIDICHEIGTVAESNSLFTVGLTRRILADGKNIEDISVGALLSYIKKHADFYNHAYSPSRG